MEYAEIAKKVAGMTAKYPDFMTKANLVVAVGNIDFFDVWRDGRCLGGLFVAGMPERFEQLCEYVWKRYQAHKGKADVYDFCVAVNLGLMDCEEEYDAEADKDGRAMRRILNHVDWKAVSEDAEHLEV